MTPQRDLDCPLVSLPLSSRLDAHPGGMWFVSRYKTSPLKNYITSTSHKGLARGRRVLLFMQLSSEIFSVNSVQLETYSRAHSVHIHTFDVRVHRHTYLQVHKSFPFVALAHTYRGRSSLSSACDPTHANAGLLLQTCTHGHHMLITKAALS